MKESEFLADKIGELLHSIIETLSLNLSVSPLKDAPDELKDQIKELLKKTADIDIDFSEANLNTVISLIDLTNEIQNKINEIRKSSRTSKYISQHDQAVINHYINTIKDYIRGFEDIFPEKQKIDISKIAPPEYKLSEIEQRLLVKEVEFNKKFAEFEVTLQELDSKVKEKLGKLDVVIFDTEIELDTKKEAIDAQLGTLTAATMAKDYAEFADIEKGIADEYRKYSLWAMLGVAIVVSITLWQSASGYFTVTESFIRLSFLVIISAPAIYLTRESAKHRQQENSHRQTNLDLRAITPYIASLSKSEQSHLKTQIAMRIFGARNTQSTESNQMPINANEILMKLLDKVEFGNKNQSSNNKDS